MEAYRNTKARLLVFEAQILASFRKIETSPAEASSPAEPQFPHSHRRPGSGPPRSRRRIGPVSLMRLRGVIEQLKRPARLTIPIFAIQREQFTSCQMHGYPCACGPPGEGAFPPVCQSPAALNVARKAFED